MEAGAGMCKQYIEYIYIGKTQYMAMLIGNIICVYQLIAIYEII